MAHVKEGAASAEAADALNELCTLYWRPIYAEIRRRGHATADAQDLTQEFFARMLRREAFGKAERDKGRFRTYLLGALDFFLVDEWRELHAQKRGGGALMLPFDEATGEAWFQQLPASTSSPADMFDQNWALVLMDRALACLRDEYDASGRRDVFAAVEPYLSVNSGADGYADACEAIGLTPQAFAVAVHRLRKRFRHCVREQVELTVAEPSDVDAEMKHLFGI
ncbi:MAG: sigma-70 family RNA polymerase sigma factor [Verrucomicrobiaceae bacterium]|nr:sigma-70 family RNA polymerase sigma factor [Verrucomicrobiaceae bacterium]